MSPKQTLVCWIEAFHRADVVALAELYADDTVNHQVANEPIVGKPAIAQSFVMNLQLRI